MWAYVNRVPTFTLEQGVAELRGTWDYGENVKIEIAVWDHVP